MNLIMKGDLVFVVLCKFGVVLNVMLIDVELQFMEDSVNDFEMMMVEWFGGDVLSGINVGYIFVDVDVVLDLGDEYGLLNNVINVVIFNFVCCIVLDYVLEVFVKFIIIVRYGKE